MIFESYFMKLYPNFLKEFSRWVQIDEPSIVIDLVQIHKISKNMLETTNTSKLDQGFLDYNSMIDEILEISPHYNYAIPKPHKKIKVNAIDEPTPLIMTRQISKNYENSMKLKQSNSKMDDLTASKLINSNDFFNFKESGLTWDKRISIFSPKPPPIFDSFCTFINKNENILNTTNINESRIIEHDRIIEHEVSEEDELEKHDVSEVDDLEINKSKKNEFNKNVFGLSLSQNIDDFFKERK